MSRNDGMEGLKALLDGGNVREIELTFDSRDRDGIDRIDERDLPEGFGIGKIHIGENGTVFVSVEER